MLEILKPEVYDCQIRPPLPGSRQLWENVPIPRNPEAFTLNPRHNTHSAGLPQPDPQHQLDIDCWAQYALLHGCVGSDNFFVGIAMDRAFRIDCCSVFGYCVGRSLAPNPNKPHQEFMKHFACMLAQPHLYHEVIQHWDDAHPNNPFMEATSNQVSVEHMGADSIITINTVLSHILLNCILPSWIDHGYTFGLHLLNHVSLAVPGYYHQLYVETNQSRLQWLTTHGVPPPIPKWGGWWTPREDDLAQLQALLRKDEYDQKCTRLDHPKWLAIGGDPIFTQLVGRDLDDPTDQTIIEPLPPSINVGPRNAMPPCLTQVRPDSTDDLSVGPSGPTSDALAAAGLGTGSWADDV
jgi:hypothetical protein